MTNVNVPRLATLRRAIVAGLVLAAVVLAAAITFTALPGNSARPAAALTTSVIAKPVPPSTTGPTNPNSTAAPGAQSGPPEPGTARTSTEVQNPGSSASRTNGASTPIPPLLTGPAPETASATGSLVAGFPSALPVAKSSTISNSSVASSGTVVQVSLVANTSAASSDLIDYYQAVFAKVGIPGTSVPAVGGSTALSFAHGGDTVTLTVTSTKGGATYSLYGVLDAAP